MATISQVTTIGFHRIVVSIFVSIFLTTVALAVISYFINDELLSGDGSWIGPAKESWQLKVIIVAIYGAIVGAVAGIINSSFGLGVFAGMSFGLFLNLLLGGILKFFLLGSSWSDGMTKIFYASIVVGVINGAAISLINLSQRHLE